MKREFSPEEAQEVLACLQTLIERGGHDDDAYRRLEQLTNHRLVAVATSFIDRAKAKDAVDKSAFRILNDLVRNGACYLEGLRQKDERCQNRDWTPAQTAEEVVRRAEAFIRRAAVIIRSDLRTEKQKHGRERHTSECLEAARVAREPAPQEEWEATAADLEASVRFAEAVEQLSDKQKRIIRAIFWDGKPGKEVAEEMGVTPPAITYHLHNAQARLKELLADYEGWAPQRKALKQSLDGAERGLVHDCERLAASEPLTVKAAPKRTP